MNNTPDAGGGIAALFAGGTILIVELAFYVYFAFALMTIANKLNVANGWLGFIPLANIYLAT